MKKIRVFLGGYINSINAQNLNCLALAKHLDRSKFEIGTMTIYSGTLDVSELKDVKIFNAFYPHKISKYIAYALGILWADVVYLPKGEICNWNKFLIKFLRKKSFRTIEGIYSDEILDQFLNKGISKKEFENFFVGYNKIYSITNFIKEFNYKICGITTDTKVLYLGIDTKTFNYNRKRTSLENIIMIGNALKEKGVMEYLKLAELFPGINFHIVGSGHDLTTDEKRYFTKYNNIIYHGILSHKKLFELIKLMDLHILFSKTEGFPKVVIETAAASVPSIIYSDYGASEWIDNGQNGFIIDSFDESVEIINKLINNPKYLTQISKNAFLMAQKFSWENQIKNWENIIISIYKGE